ncbi:MAG: hypothetical protein ACI9JY_002498, partial [Saprospiraceae bacterium]
DLGWVCQQKTHLKFYRQDFFDVKYQINQEGFRMQRDLDDLQKTARKRILLLGDSFLFGIFLENQQTISAKLQQQLGEDYEVFNLAIPGWGIDQMYQAYEKYVAQIQPDQVILLFIDDDLQRTVEAFFWGATTKRAYHLVNGQLAFRTPTDGSLNAIESSFVFNFQIVNRLYHYWHQQQGIHLSKAIFNQLGSREKGRGKPLTILRIPRKEQVLQNDCFQTNLTHFLKNQDIKFDDLIEPFKGQTHPIDYLYLPNDDHLSEKGTALVAKCLFDSVW